MRTPRISVRKVLVNALADIRKNHIMTLSAGLSYYFVLSLFPLLILCAAVLAFLPIPNLFQAVLDTLAQVVPSESMGVVRRVVETVVIPRGGVLTFGLIGVLWTASSGFAGLIEALNVAYDVPETRPFWKTRLLAIGLMFATGWLFMAALGLLLLGPVAVHWIQSVTGLGELGIIWPYAKWLLSIIFTIVGVELLFYWAPNVKQRFWATLPGAAVGVSFFVASSYALGVYFRNYAHYNKTYGVLGAAMGLVVWLYYSWFAVLVGAEINSELIKESSGGKLELKQKPPEAVAPVSPWQERPAEEKPAA